MELGLLKRAVQELDDAHEEAFNMRWMTGLVLDNEYMEYQDEKLGYVFPLSCHYRVFFLFAVD